MSRIALDRVFFQSWDNFSRAEVLAYAAWCVGIKADALTVEVDAHGLIAAVSVADTRFPTLASHIDIYPRSPAIRHSAYVYGQTMDGQAARAVLADAAALARAEARAGAELNQPHYADGRAESVALTLAYGYAMQLEAFEELF